MRKMLLATFHEAEPAQQLRTRLEQAGIQAVVEDESKLQRFWFLSEPLAAIHVEVPGPDYEKAARLIQEWDQAQGLLKEAVRCPSCHSPRVEFPQLTRKFITPSLGTLLMVIGLIPREFYCHDCHYTWPKALRLQPSRDALGWPKESKLWHSEGVKKAK